MPLWKSRKFRLTLGMCLISAGAALAGEITWQKAVYVMTWAFSVNVLGITIEDFATKWWGGHEP